VGEIGCRSTGRVGHEVAVGLQDTAEILPQVRILEYLILEIGTCIELE
jgi:hypothetical protein